MEELKRLIESMSTELTINTEEAKKLTAEVHSSIREVRELKKVVEKLGSNLSEIEKRLSKVEMSRNSTSIESNARRKNIVIYNLLEEEEENVRTLADKCLTFFNKIDVQIDDRDIDYVRRLGKIKGKRPILLKFVTLKKKN